MCGASWTTEKPAILATRAPTPRAADKADKVDKADKAGKAAIAGKGGAPMIGSMESAMTGRKLGVAKPECVYKPVMTAEDMANCR